jgi:histidinol-phosphate aminotransferase
MTTIQGMPNLGPGLRLHLNENTGGCSPKVLAAIQGISMTEVASYADYEGAVRDTAAYLGVDADWLVLTNGLDEGLLLTAIAYLLPRAPEALVALGAPPMAASGQAEQILMLPTFEPYVINAKALGARAIAIPSGPDFEFPIEAVLGAVTVNTRLIFINTPHNPSGRPVGEAVIRRIAERADHAVVFVDEAYHDFHGVNVLHLVREYPNVLIGHTFSKAHGLAGMRVGVLVAQPALLESIRFVMPLFNLNSVAVAALRAALADGEFMPWYVAQARQSKALLDAALDRLGLRYWKSEANFVLVDGGARAAELVAGMIAGGVLVRDRSNEPGCANCFRMTTGVVEHTRTGIVLLEALCAKR